MTTLNATAGRSESITLINHRATNADTVRTVTTRAVLLSTGGVMWHVKNQF